MDYMDDDLEGEAPCEFCGDLYPLVLLIEHQSTHLTGDDDFSYLDDIMQQEQVAQSIISEDLGLKNKSEVTAEQIKLAAEIKEPEVIIEQKQQSAATNPTKTDNENSKTEERQSPSKSKAQAESVSTQQKQNLLFNQTLKDIKKFPEQKGKEYITEKGEKLLVYGDDIDPDKELENEKPAYKMPDNPLLNSVSKNEDIEDINNLSDDDCDYTLEEFWKRAREFLKSNRTRNQC